MANSEDYKYKGGALHTGIEVLIARNMNSKVVLLDAANEKRWGDDWEVHRSASAVMTIAAIGIKVLLVRDVDVLEGMVGLNASDGGREYWHCQGDEYEEFLPRFPTEGRIPSIVCRPRCQIVSLFSRFLVDSLGNTNLCLRRWRSIRTNKLTPICRVNQCLVRVVARYLPLNRRYAQDINISISSYPTSVLWYWFRICGICPLVGGILSVVVFPWRKRLGKYIQ